MPQPILPVCHRTRRDIAHAPAPSALHKISYLHHGLIGNVFEHLLAKCALADGLKALL